MTLQADFLRLLSLLLTAPMFGLLIVVIGQNLGVLLRLIMRELGLLTDVG